MVKVGVRYEYIRVVFRKRIVIFLGSFYFQHVDSGR